MAEDDIYGSKKKYEGFKANLASLLKPPIITAGRKRTSWKYFCKNPRNIQHFETLFAHFEAKDFSYIRRHRMLQTMRLICFLTESRLEACDRVDIDAIVRQMHEVYESPKSKQTFIADIKRIWKIC